MNYILKAYYESALALKLPVTYIEEIKSLHIGLGKRNYFLLRGITQLNNASSINVSNNKYTTKWLLDNAGFPVPHAVSISKNRFHKDPLPELIKDLRFPLVAKPNMNTNSGKDVFCNIKSCAELADFLENAFQTHSEMLIEEFHNGLKEYRVLLLKGRVIGVVERFAERVIGDGHQTIEQLMLQTRANPSDDVCPDSLVNANDDCKNCLNDQGLSLHSIPQKNQIIKLRYAVNRGLGGRVVSLGKKMNQENAESLGQVAKITGLDLVGLDILCEDINLPFNKTNWLILETNFPPDITLHESPDEGKSINVSKKILLQIIFQHPFAYLQHRLKRIFFKNTRS